MAVHGPQLERLEQLYQTSGNSMIVLYGRPGMEKKELMKSFLQGKKGVYYYATQCSEEEQRRLMARTIERTCDVKIKEDTYEQMFNRIKSGNASKLVFVIDNFENIVKKDPDFIANIIALKDRKRYPGPVMIVLCSDALSYVEGDMAEEKSLTSKIDETIKVGEVNFLEIVRRFPNYSVSQSIEVYGVLGGVPGYLQYWNDKLSLKANICAQILSPNGRHFHEAEDYITAQLREYGVYYTILSAIAQGKEKLNDIFLYTGYSRPKISVYIKNLMQFEVIEKVASFETGGSDNAKKAVYRIKNTFLNFWFRFVFQNRSQLYVMTPEEFYDTYIQPEIDSYLNRYFIQVCMEYFELSSAVKQLPITISKMGTWVGKKGDVDIVAQDRYRHTIVGQCSWSEPEFTYEMFETLKNNIQYAKIKTEFYYLFSAKKFEPKLIQASKEDSSIVLVDMNRL